MNALVAFLIPSLAAGDLWTAVRRNSPGSPVALPAAPPLSGHLVVPLRRARARQLTAHGPVDASFYLGKVTVGHPAQELQVTFDTSSGNVLLPHRACKSLACTEHARYSPWESSTAMDIGVNGSLAQAGHRLADASSRREGVTLEYTQSDFGEGKAAAVLVRDNLCFGPATAGEACVDMALLASTELDNSPFRAMPSDGIIGLALEPLAAGQLFSFGRRLFEGSGNVVPQFGLYFGEEEGELHVGGHESSRLAAELTWFPVDHPKDGYWQVAIRRVLVGDAVLDDCKRGCHGIIDSGVSRLGVQASNLPALRASLAPAMLRGVCHGPDLIFDLGGYTLTLRPSDYADVDCTAQLGSLNLEEPQFVGVYAFGATVLRRYYAAFDWERLQVGFAPLKETKSLPTVASDPSIGDLVLV